MIGRDAAMQMTPTTDALKRSFYLFSLPLAMIAVSLLVVAEWRQGTLHIVDALGLPLLVLLFGTLTLGLWRGAISVTRLEVAAFSGVVPMYLASLGYSLFSLPQAQAALWNLTGLGYWSPIVYALAFLIFGVKVGLRMSLLVYAISLLVWFIYFIILFLADETPMGGAVFYQLFASNGLLLVMLYGVGRAFVAQAQQTAQLEHAAHTDPLTQLYNRRFLTQCLAQVVSSLGHAQPLSLVLVDLDHFKKINDVYGHGVGDRVLQGVSRYLLDHARKMDVVGRWGGEEFLLVLPDTALPEALGVAEQLRAGLEQSPDEATGTLTASFGVVQAGPGEAVAGLLERADRTLYRAKGAGRNRVEGDAFSPADSPVKPQVSTASLG